MNNPVTRAVDSVVGSATDLADDFVGKAANVKNKVVNTADKALDYAVSVRDIKRNPPTQVTIADLFHRKLYDYADFDFLIKYLQTNGIATCKNIYTINSLATEVVPSLTESALRARDVRKVNATYAGIMRLCKRRRKGMLAYLSIDGHAQVCLIKSWDRFLQLAGFNNATTADKLTFNTEDVFPRLRISKNLNARIAKYNEQAIEERKAKREAVAAAIQPKQPLADSEYKSLSLDDTEIEQTASGSTTKLFKAGSDIDFAQMLAMNYSKVRVNDDLEWDAYHAADYFLYYIISRAYPDYKSVRSLKEFFKYIVELFDSVGFGIDAKVLQQLSDNRLRDLKNALGMYTVEKNDKIDAAFDKVLLSLAVKYFVFDVDTKASYQDIYNNEVIRIKNKRAQLTTKIKNMTSLIRIPTDEELAEYVRFEPDFINLINTQNADIFAGMWNAAKSGKFIDLTEDGFDKIACMLVYDKTKKPGLTLAEYDNDLIITINELLPDAQINWELLFTSTSNDILKACRIVRNVKHSSSSHNAAAKAILCQAVSKFYNFRVSEDEMWQQIYIGICNAKKSAPKSGLTVMSGAEALGLAESTDIIGSVANDLDDMELQL